MLLKDSQSTKSCFMKIKKMFAGHVVSYMSCISHTFAVKCFKKNVQRRRCEKADVNQK